jgi:hypothetical protein
MRLKTELYDVLIDAIENGIEDPEKLTYAIEDVCGLVLLPIIKYCEKHGNITLQCGSEWLYQDDSAQIDAMKLVGDIFDNLVEYQDEENENERNS